MYEVEFHDDGDGIHIYVGTLYGGVWRLEDFSLGADSSANRYIPQRFRLDQPFPNPFNPTTTIEFLIPKSGLVTLTVYDVLGREIETILNQHIQAGHHKVQWNASDVPSGIYFIRMQSGDFSQVRKCIAVK